ncbi:MAG: hypothetical protein ACSHXL_00015 [Bacteroidota bacterium]
MSKIALEPNAAGTGTFTIASPDSNTNRTLTLPDETGTMLTSVSAIPAANLTGALPAIDGSALTGVANPVKAWVNFNGTGTVAIRDSFNVSSITDLGIGDYRVNFTTNMASANYAAVVTVQTYREDYQAEAYLSFTTPPTVSSVGIRTGRPAVGFVDFPTVNLVVVGG